MNPWVQGTAGLLFACCLAAHAVLWRWRRPRREVTALLLLFLAAPSLLLAPHGLGEVWRRIPGLAGVRPTEAWATLVLCLAFGAAYVASYPAVQAQSPSLAALLAVASSPSRTLRRGALREALAATPLVAPRIEELVAWGWLRREEGALCLTRRGRAVLLPFLALRALLGLPPGRG